MTSMRDRLHLMQLLREETPDELVRQAWQPKADEIDENVQAVAQGLVEKQAEIQRRVSTAVAAEALPQEDRREELLGRLQTRAEAMSFVNQELRAAAQEEEKKLEKTGQSVARLAKDLVDLRVALQGVQGGSRMESLAIDASRQLMGRRLDHWHPEAPRPPKKSK